MSGKSTVKTTKEQIKFQSYLLYVTRLCILMLFCHVFGPPLAGVYIGWRCPEFTWDCQRVSNMSKCFCGHLLGEHAQYNSETLTQALPGFISSYKRKLLLSHFEAHAVFPLVSIAICCVVELSKPSNSTELNYKKGECECFLVFLIFR